jgi:hypothetical protein
MTKEILRKNILLTAIIQVGLIVVVVFISWVFGWFNLFALGTVLTLVGTIILVVAIFVAMGGFFSKSDDLAAFSLSGAGKMDEHMKNIRSTRQGRLGFMILGIANGVLTILIGFTLQTLGQ